MTNFLVGLTVLLLAFAAIAATFSISNARAVASAQPKPWFTRYGGVIASAILTVETIFAVTITGLAAGITLVLAALMLCGLLFTLAVNAWPKKTMHAAAICGAIGFASMSLILLQ